MRTAMLVLLILPFATGCSMEASLNQLSPTSVYIAQDGFTNVAVTSNQSDESIESGYKVQASSGAITNQIAQRTADGTLVFSSTQGALLDNQTATSMQQNLSVPAQ